jgi:predicted component of viral defense system (DUF524 family)
VKLQSRESIVLSFSSITGDASRRLVVSTLPKRRRQFGDELWAQTAEVESTAGQVLFEVMEGGEYRFEWIGLVATAGALVTDPEELFEPDDATGLSGRLRPRLSTGIVDASLRTAEGSSCAFAFEVRSRKLEYKSEYQWMLRDVAQHMTELVMHRFAAARMTFAVDDRRDAATLYEQFEFLRAALQGDRLRQAFGRILQSPHVEWQATEQSAPISLGIKSSADVGKQLARAGRRVPWTATENLSSVPQRVLSRRTEPTSDTPPNRFLRYAIEHWRGVLWRVLDAFESKSDTALVLRARREISGLIDELDELLRTPLLQHAGRLDQFPASNQVLQKREGYRDFLKTFIEFELAAMLTWHSQEETYKAGQRDIAELYEFWAFLQLGTIVGNLLGKPFFLGPLLQASGDGLNIALRGGSESVLSGELTRHARTLRVALHFNRTFDAKSVGNLAWTRPMRPDMTLTVTRTDEDGLAGEPTHVHFDAKYRVQVLDDLFGDEEGATALAAPASGGSTTAKRDDLLKMHAYRDAIRRTAGAYVLYPGQSSAPLEFREFHELLPGLGAFVLRPSAAGRSSGSELLEDFIDRVLDQSALRFTQLERSQHWLTEIHGPEYAWRSGYAEPPAQASVLLGFVKSRQHWEWVRRTRTYNVRAQPRRGGVTRDAALLQSQLLLLYCPETSDVAMCRIVGNAERVTAEAMAEVGYPSPSSEYWCVQISELPDFKWLEGMRASAVEQYVASTTSMRGKPTLVTWRDVSFLRAHSPG